MKKVIIFIVLVGTLISNYNNYPKTTNTKESNKEIRSVFISYIELNKYIKGNSKDISKKSKKNIKNIINNIKKIKCNTIILQVRANCDAIYKSKLYPSSMNIVLNEGDKSYDVLDLFIKEAHKKKVKVIAWINPYRIRTTNDVTTISTYSPAYKYLNTDTIYINNGIYFNPSKKEVEDLIVEGVKWFII